MGDLTPPSREGDTIGRGYIASRNENRGKGQKGETPPAERTGIGKKTAQRLRKNGV